MGVSVLLSALQSGTTYHYRAVASNQLAVVQGEDITFSHNSLPTMFTEIMRIEGDPAVIRMGFEGQADQYYEVEASTNLLDWETIGAANQVSPGMFEFIDADITGRPTRFYRVLSP